MELLAFYIIITYLIMLGMIIGSHAKGDKPQMFVSYGIVLLFAPILIPIIIGIVITDK